MFVVGKPLTGDNPLSSSSCYEPEPWSASQQPALACRRDRDFEKGKNHLDFDVQGEGTQGRRDREPTRGHWVAGGPASPKTGMPKSGQPGWPEPEVRGVTPQKPQARASMVAGGTKKPAMGKYVPHVNRVQWHGGWPGEPQPEDQLINDPGSPCATPALGPYAHRGWDHNENIWYYGMSEPVAVP